MTRLDPALVERMRAIVGTPGVLVGAHDLEARTIDWRKRYAGPSDAVLLPRSTEEVAALVRLCAGAGIAIIPQGGNTGQSGGAVALATQGANVLVCLDRLNRIRDISRENSTITVEAGVVLKTVQDAAESVGRFFPLSLGAEGSCQIGGNLSTNAGGTAVLRYGNARDLVLGIEVVLPSGEIWDGMRMLRKDNSGYDLKALFLGAEGTLGIVTAAVLKLFAPPVERAVAWVAVDGLQPAVELLTLLSDSFQSRLSAFEYLSREQLLLVLKHVQGTSDPLPHDGAGCVLIELTDSLATGMLAPLLEAGLATAMERGLARNAVIAASHAQSAALWKIRHSVSEANRAEGVSLNHDVAVPTAAVPAFVAQATAYVDERFPQAQVITVAHLGDGNVHFLAIFPREMWAALPDADSYAASVRSGVYEIAHRHGGTFSAEHGIGQSLTREMSRYKPAIELELMRGIKGLLDPQGLMNPGKVIPAPR